jgi:hypothetical protein
MKTLKTFGSIPTDKLLHFFLWITVIVAAAKEIIWDWLMKKGNPELLDFIFTIIPAGMFLILC